METPATFDQSGKWIDLGKGAPRDRMQDVLAHGYLVKSLFACPDLSKVDRTAYEALLAGRLTYQPLQPSIPWTSVDEYAARIMARSKLRRWGLTKVEVSKMAESLHDHAGSLSPTGVSLWLGKDLAYNRAEMIAWLKDEVETLGFTFQDYTGPDRTSFLPGSELAGGRRLRVVDLDLDTFWDQTNGLVPRNVRSQRDKWPGLEVATLLALNPQVYVAMDGKTIPYMFAPGLVVVSVGLPVFDLDGREAYVFAGWDDGRWSFTSIVAFRE